MTTDVSEAKLPPETFRNLAELAKREFGLSLGSEKQMMVQSRLKSRLRALNMSDFSSYSDFVHSNDGASERNNLISALTTNVSHFFREDHHFDQMYESLADTFQRKIKSGERIRIWSAGCSTGQEPCSIVMYLLEKVPNIASADFRVLATDIDQKVLAVARAGTYGVSDLREIPDAFQKAHTQKNAQNDEFTVSQDIRKFISFKELNLLRNWPIKGKFDAIFCRNVVIYFDNETQSALWPRFCNALYDHGLLFLGHSERIQTPSDFGMSTIGPTAYSPQSANR